jgi:hypothetical protein
MKIVTSHSILILFFLSRLKLRNKHGRLFFKNWMTLLRHHLLIQLAENNTNVHFIKINSKNGENKTEKMKRAYVLAV